jgi:hypothetical protein
MSDEHPFQKWRRLAEILTAEISWIVTQRGGRPLLPAEACRIRRELAIMEGDFVTAEKCQEDLVEIARHVVCASNGV